MHLILGGLTVDLWPKLFFITLMFATGLLAVSAVIAAIWSRRSKRLAKLQESQFRHSMAQITLRRRLAEIVDTPAAL